MFTMTADEAFEAQEQSRDDADQELQQRCDEVGLSFRFITE